MKRERLTETGRTPSEKPAISQPPKKGRAVDLFLDSGVFSAWARDTSLDIKKYAKYIERNKHLFECYATMDVIPGKFRQKRTTAEIENSAKGSYDNHQYLKGRGLKPIPIFHQGEQERWLEQYILDGEKYIGISTAKDLYNFEQRQWLDHIFTMLTDSKGVPYVKTHGFGITSIPLIMRYPWYTCDSTTWSLAAGYGLAFVPQMANALPDYQHLPIRIIMSGRKQSSWGAAVRQYEALVPFDKEWVDRWFAYVGTDAEKQRYLSSERRKVCLRYFTEFNEHYEVPPFAHRQGEGFGKFKPILKKDAPAMWPHMRIMMATMMYNGQFSQILNAANARNRLVSYWELMNRDDQLLENFVQHGITDINYTPRPARVDWKNETFTSQRRMKLLERIRSYDGQTEAD